MIFPKRLIRTVGALELRVSGGVGLEASRRVKAGGHDVPECKIRERYQRLWSLGATAITHCDSANV